MLPPQDGLVGHAAPSRRRFGWRLSLAVAVAFYVLSPATSQARPSLTRAAEGGALQIQVPKEKVDLKEHHLEIVVSRAPARVRLTVVGESEATLDEREIDLTGRRAGEAILLSWQPSNDEQVAKIEIKVWDREDFFTGVMLTPWSIYIPHEEVTFATDSATVQPGEEGKLAASLEKIAAALARHQEIARGVRLYIAGHTDRVGNDAYNLKLSQARAQAIGRWFRGHGLRLPIAFEGFGEQAPAINTADGVDEPRNRRVDYILSVDEPTVRTTGFRPVWKRVN